MLLRFKKEFHKTFEGDKCLDDMLFDLQKLSKKCIDSMEINEKMKMSSSDRKNFDDSKRCYLCDDKFNEKLKAKLKVRDHDHRTGKYRGGLLCIL